ncbi:hypothetical protein RIF29_32278 [Crotalaria pallida]|uniref:glucan endo-1,3-beta-D-glucosidase n=1 Tax=Crotalaria pallida TaxID=3830 RepID=A0AAN9EHY5_CROPI
MKKGTMHAVDFTTCSMNTVQWRLVRNIHSQSFIGVNYGELADNLPLPEYTASLIKSTSIGKVRLYSAADAGMISALADSGVEIVIAVTNGEIPVLAADAEAASQWVTSRVVPYYPNSNITLITVGDETMTMRDEGLISSLLPAMRNVKNALNEASLGNSIKVTTVNSMALLSHSDPPSFGSFNPELQDTVKELLLFLKDNESPFAINLYPMRAYASNPTPETLSFCLFQPSSARVDFGNSKNYTNMFDYQVDAVYSALRAMEFPDIEIVVAATGWPSRGDPNEVGPSILYAKAYNQNLVSHLRSLVGTPLMPGKSVDTFIYALYDADLKTGRASEQAFGLYKTDLTMAYDVGLAKPFQQVTTHAFTPVGVIVPEAAEAPQLKANFSLC